MSTEITFRGPFSMLFSISTYCYQNLVDFREGTAVNQNGFYRQKSGYELSTGRMILVEAVFIPLIVLSGIETVIRGALYLVAAPFLMGIGLYGREENESIGSAILKGPTFALAFECMPLATLTASVKGLYRNIFSEELPSPEGDSKVEKFIGNELSCGFAPDWYENLV